MKNKYDYLICYNYYDRIQDDPIWCGTSRKLAYQMLRGLTGKNQIAWMYPEIVEKKSGFELRIYRNNVYVKSIWWKD